MVFDILVNTDKDVIISIIVHPILRSETHRFNVCTQASDHHSSVDTEVYHISYHFYCLKGDGGSLFSSSALMSSTDGRVSVIVGRGGIISVPSSILSLPHSMETNSVSDTACNGVSAPTEGSIDEEDVWMEEDAPDDAGAILRECSTRRDAIEPLPPKPA